MISILRILHRSALLFIALLVLPVLACGLPSDAGVDTIEKAGEVATGLIDTVAEKAEGIQGVTPISGGSSAGSENEGSASAADSGSTDAGGDLAESFQSSLAMDAMRLVISTYDGRNDSTTVQTLAFVRPGRFQMITGNSEVISVDGTTYLRTSASGEWTSSPGDMSAGIESALEMFVSSEAIESRQQDPDNDWTNFKDLGTKEIGGVKTQGYEHETSLPNTDFYTITRMWIGVEDSLMYRQEIEGNASGYLSKTTMDFEYGDSVQIEPPI